MESTRYVLDGNFDEILVFTNLSCLWNRKLNWSELALFGFVEGLRVSGVNGN